MNFKKILENVLIAEIIVNIVNYEGTVCVSNFRTLKNVFEEICEKIEIIRNGSRIETFPLLKNQVEFWRERFSF